MYNAINRYLKIRRTEDYGFAQTVEYVSDMLHWCDSINVLYDGESLADVVAWSGTEEFSEIVFTEEIVDAENYEQAIWDAISKAFGVLLNRC